MQAKMVLPLDSEMMKVRMHKEIEGPYKLALANQKADYERLEADTFELRKEHELLRTAHENLKYESERELNDVRARNKDEVNSLLLQNQSLLAKVEENKDRELLRQVRREVEEHRRRAAEYLEEAGELRKERDALKLERNEMLINNARAVEEERTQKRALVGENDKLRYQLKCAEESLQASVIKCDKK